MLSGFSGFQTTYNMFFIVGFRGGRGEGAPKVLPGARNGREVMSFLLGLGRGIREVVPVPHDWMNGYLDR